MSADLCHNCRLEFGFRRKDGGFHTAVVKACSNCGKQKPILPERHWIKNEAR